MRSDSHTFISITRKNLTFSLIINNCLTMGAIATIKQDYISPGAPTPN